MDSISRNEFAGCEVECGPWLGHPLERDLLDRLPRGRVHNRGDDAHWGAGTGVKGSSSTARPRVVHARVSPIPACLPPAKGPFTTAETFPLNGHLFILPCEPGKHRNGGRRLAAGKALGRGKTAVDASIWSDPSYAAASPSGCASLIRTQSVSASRKVPCGRRRSPGLEVDRGRSLERAGRAQEEVGPEAVEG